MKRYSLWVRSLILGILVVFTSCLQELDDVPESYVRVYGPEGESEVEGLTKLENGHLLLYGTEIKPRFRDGLDIIIPFLVETDEFGNQIQYRNYMFYKGEFKLRFASVDAVLPGFYGTDEFISTESGLERVLQLRDGSFFCIGYFRLVPDNPSWSPNNGQYEEFYLHLDKDLEPLEWGFFDDSEVEGPPQYFSGVSPYSLHELPSGEIILSTFFREFDTSNFTIINRGFTILKFVPGTGLTELFRVSSGNGNILWDGRGFVISPDGSSIIVNVPQFQFGGLVGVGSFADEAQTSLFQIDISSGTVLNSRVYRTRGISYNLVSSDNGYVMQVYHPAPEDPYEQNTRSWWGSLLFVNQNLDSMKLENITETNNILVGNRRIIRTRDGGYVTEFQKNIDYGLSSVLIKTDAQGEVLWRHEEGPNTWIKDIVEMDDGGIAYVVRKGYNGIGFRTTLVKLTADGKL